MKKSQTEPTTVENFEEKFDRGEDVLDYFDVGKARVIKPQSKIPGAKPKSAYPVKPNPTRHPVVREKPGSYRKKTG
jgi:hypothetical protein